MAITPDYGASLAFLRLLYPSGPWMLTAISTDKKTIRAKTFSADESGKVQSWLEKFGNFNLYYSVNRPVESAFEKPKLLKSEIAAAHFLHVDVDPREGEDLASEQERIRKLVEGYKIQPTFIIFSGGGYNALWQLEKPFLIADTPGVSEASAVALAEDLERRNWQLELDFDTPDHCRDVSRILRLPGTVNHPDAKKAAKGRVEAFAHVVTHTEVSYPLSKFMATTAVSTNVSSGRAAVAASNIRRTESLDSLKISDKTKIIIAQGFDPEKHSSISTADRSQYVLYIVCELIRCGVPEEVILGVITDSRYGISTSVLEKGASMMRYACRQIERARDMNSGEPIGEMNDKYAIVLGYGSQTLVMIEDGVWSDRTNRYEPIFQSFRNFSSRVKNMPSVEIPQENGKVKYAKRFDWWTGHQHRREYESVCFEPGLDTPGRYNLWTGYAYQAQPGDKHERLIEHIFENICAADKACYDYLLKWMARVVQQPRTRSMVSPVLLSRERGVGKSVFTDFFGAIFEPHRCTVADIGSLTGKFNSHLATSLLVVAEEAFDLRDRRHESVLKELITGTSIGIERKGVDRIEMPNYTHLIMTSNNERVVPAGDFERRFFVLRVAPNKLQDSAYFLKILEDQRRGGVANLLHHLMSVSLENFDVTHVPKTRALQEQQEHNLPPELVWLIDKLHYGLWTTSVAIGGPTPLRLIFDDYRQFMIDGGKQRAMMARRVFERFVESEFPGVPHDSEDKFVLIFPSLDECRWKFSQNRGWDPTTVQWKIKTDGSKVVYPDKFWKRDEEKGEAPF